MSNIDRRGLGEIVAWASALVVLGILLLTSMIRTGTFDPSLMGALLGLTTALVARGTQSASERSARGPMSDDELRRLAEVLAELAPRPAPPPLPPRPGE